MKKIVNNFFKNQKNKQQGFTLLELLVVIALLSILLSISMFNYSNFGRDVELENSAYTTALAVREVQVFGINRESREGTYTNAKNTFSDSNYRYGFYIEKDSEKLVLFRDGLDQEQVPTEAGIYNKVNCGASGSECYSEIILTRRNKIHEIKIINSSGGEESVESVNISFLRPDPDATIVSVGSTHDTVEKSASRVNITISDGEGDYGRCVSIGYAGDISIKDSC